MFEIPSVIILIITSTRMHRSLVDFASGSSDVYEYDTLHFNASLPPLFSPSARPIWFRTNENPQLTSLVLSKAKGTDTALTALDRVEVSMHTAPEQHPTGTAMSGEGTSTTISTSEQISNRWYAIKAKPHSSIYMPPTNRLSISYFRDAKRLMPLGA
jgi:hypothetical protein